MAVSPSHSAKKEASSPSRNSSTTISPPASPRAPPNIMSIAASASATFAATTTPLPAASPSALTTTGARRAADIGLGRRRRAEAFVGRGGNAVRPAQVLGEALGAFEAGGGAARAEGLGAGGFEVIDDACAERRLGPDNDQIDAVLTAIRDHRRMVADIERNALRLTRDARIARGTDEPVYERACRHLPGQRMFAAAGAKEQDVHGLQHIAGAPLARQRAGATLWRGRPGLDHRPRNPSLTASP